MRSMNRSSRREFVRLTGLAAGVAGLAVPSTGRAAGQPGPDRDPDAVLARLHRGQQAVRERPAYSTLGGSPKTSRHSRRGRRRWRPSSACADSRVAPELVFDQGVGDLFVVRVAGNIVSGAGPTVKGSIEFAVAVLGVRLIMVLGHSQCGAVKAAIEHIDANDALPGSIGELIDPIRPAVLAVKGRPGDKLENVIRANVEKGVERSRVSIRSCRSSPRPVN